MERITLFLSCGRSGTQWLSANLRRLYHDDLGVAVVRGEPLGPRYRPRDFFRGYDEPLAALSVDEIREHVDYIARAARKRPYIEVGWPSYAAIPLLVERFGVERVSVVRLVRHPVPTALSHLTHRAYAGRGDDYERFAFLDPSCPGAIQKEYAGRWDGMSPYEKCLFFWTEIQLYGDELCEVYPQLRAHDVRSEDMIDPRSDALERLLGFLELPLRREFLDARTSRVDRYNRPTPVRFDWREVFAHPRTIAAAERRGYDVSAVDAAELDQRYALSLSGRLQTYARRTMRRLADAVRRS